MLHYHQAMDIWSNFDILLWRLDIKEHVSFQELVFEMASMTWKSK